MKDKEYVWIIRDIVENSLQDGEAFESHQKLKEFVNCVKPDSCTI